MYATVYVYPGYVVTIENSMVISRSSIKDGDSDTRQARQHRRHIYHSINPKTYCGLIGPLLRTHLYLLDTIGTRTCQSSPFGSVRIIRMLGCLVRAETRAVIVYYVVQAVEARPTYIFDSMSANVCKCGCGDGEPEDKVICKRVIYT
jgi:hypothetical protein